MLTWIDVALAYAVYLAALSWIVPRFARARTAALCTALLAGAMWWCWPSLVTLPLGTSPLVWVVIPSLALLGTYRVSGVFFVRPSPALEHTLMTFDASLLHRSGALRAYRRAGLVTHEAIELLYLCVYLVVPLGATVLLLGRRDALGTYWATVFLAELACYAALPWLQSRPPRALEGGAQPLLGLVRRLNLLLLHHGSIQVNTVPSAHAAGAVAVGLAVWSAMPAAGLAFLVLAAGITLATVLGRYHYAADSILGVAVALGAWGVLVF